MKQESDLYRSYAYRKRLRDALVNWLNTQHFDAFVTLGLNRPATTYYAQMVFKDWLARIDRAFLGKKWSKQGSKRTFAIASTEHPTTNAHLHVLLRFPATTHLPKSGRQIAVLSHAWKQVSGTNDFHSITIDLNPKFTSYAVKYLTDEASYESWMISSMFHSTEPAG